MDTIMERQRHTPEQAVRISEEIIERVKREVSLVRVVELAGIELRRQGKDLLAAVRFTRTARRRW